MASALLLCQRRGCPSTAHGHVPPPPPSLLLLASSDQDSQSRCSTIESPRHGIVDDYLSGSSSSDHPLSPDTEFSTDVSSTRKRLK